MKTNRIKEIIFLLLALFITHISFPFLKNTFEGFSAMTPGMYPISTDVPLLYEEYPLKTHPGVSENTYQDNYPDYPVLASSYEQKTNNIRYWKNPNNGKCSPADFCGGLYENKNIEPSQSPASIPFSSPDIRVNYYGSHKLVCPTTDV